MPRSILAFTFCVLLPISLSFLASHAVWGQSPDFNAGRVVRTAEAPKRPVVGDLTGDGRPDVVLVHSQEVSVYRGDARGLFELHHRFAPPSFLPQAVAVGDFRRVGILDLAIVSISPPRLQIERGDGVGGFLGGPSLTFPSNPIRVQARDFDRDGFCDLAVLTGGSSAAISILLSDGSGGFSLVQEIGSLSGAPVELLVGDFDRDGILDLFTLERVGGTLSLYRGLAEGRFSVWTSVSVGSRPESMATGDFDGDGLLDFAVVNEGNDELLLLYGRAMGFFDPEQRVPLGFVPRHVTSGDLDGDSVSDLVLADADDRRVRVYRASGSRTYSPVGSIAIPSDPRSALAVDLTQDGRLDLLAVTTLAGFLASFLSRGDGTFEVPVSSTTPGPPKVAAVGDLNRDGFLDVVCTDETDQISLFQGDGALGLTLLESQGAIEARDLALSDIDGDGNLDVSVLGSSSTEIFAGDGTGTVTRRPSVDVGGDRVAWGDFDEDGYLDLAVAQSGIARIDFGDGAFGVERPLEVIDLDAHAVGVVRADFDTDGSLDLVTADFSEVLFHRGNGDGTFQSPTSLENGEDAARVVTGDFDGDGNLDLVLLRNRVIPSLTLYSGDGQGGFTSVVPDVVSNQQGVENVVAADFDGDGHLDLAVAASGGLIDIEVHLGDGQGRFPVKSVVSDGTRPNKLLPGDFDGDGNTDLAAIHEFNGQFLTIYRWDGTTQPWQLTSFANFTTVTRATSIAAADVDRDGDLDLGIPSASSASPVIHLNDGAGGFESFYELPVIRFAADLEFADFDGDGDSDLVVAGGGGIGQTSLRPFGYYENIGGLLEFRASVPVRWRASSLVSGDFDEDGRLDLAAHASFGRVLVFPGHPRRFFTNQRVFVASPTPIGFRCTDLDSDGNLDLVTLGGDELFLLFGDGRGGMDEEVLQPLPSTATAAAFGDLTGDGRMDVVFSLEGDNRVFLWRFDRSGAHGSFTEVSRTPVGVPPREIAVDDFDGDGFLDVAVGSTGFHGFEILPGGLGGLCEPVGFATSNPPTLLLGADLRGQGMTDVLYAEEGESRLFLIPNRSHTVLVQGFAGNVNAGVGPPADVLFVNGSSGQGLRRSLELLRGQSMEMTLDAPPSKPFGPSAFSLYVWAALPPSGDQIRYLPFGLGLSCGPFPLRPLDSPQPVRTANNLGFPRLLGREDWPGPATRPAPTVLLSVSSLPGPVDLVVQGLIEDSASPQGQLAVTNAMTLRVR